MTRLTAMTSSNAFADEAVGYMPSLMSVALRLTRSQAESEDLVQETFVKAVRAEQKFEPGTNMKAWLLKILTNTFINRYRRGNLERSIVEGPQANAMLDGWMSTASMAAMHDPESAALRPILEKEIRGALEALPEDFRVVVLLSDVEEMSYKEIAEIIDRPIGTVMSRLHRGRQLLKAQLVEHARAMGILAEESPSTEASPPVDMAAYRARRARSA
jgi:RNA polymerase sigma-70 factor, ECF subfamily